MKELIYEEVVTERVDGEPYGERSDILLSCTLFSLVPVLANIIIMMIYNYNCFVLFVIFYSVIAHNNNNSKDRVRESVVKTNILVMKKALKNT